MKTEPFDTADGVLHKPSNEHWLVGYCRGGYVANCGWPAGLTPVGEFELVRKATLEEREKLLIEMSKSDGHLGGYAREIFRERAESTAGAGI